MPSARGKAQRLMGRPTSAANSSDRGVLRGVIRVQIALVLLSCETSLKHAVEEEWQMCARTFPPMFCAL